MILAYKKLEKKELKLKRLKTKSKTKKTFDDYFKECIKNKVIPKDTPLYFKKALERAMKEYEQGIKLEKSALANIVEKYVIEGKPRILPTHYFLEKEHMLKDFLSKHRREKVRMVLKVEMKRNVKKIKALFHIKQLIRILNQKSIRMMEKKMRIKYFLKCEMKFCLTLAVYLMVNQIGNLMK